MAHNEATEAFEKSLVELERAAGAAIIPGDCSIWCNAVSEAIASMTGKLHENVVHHDAVLKDLLEEHLELQSPIDKLQADDTELERSLSQIDASLNAIMAESAQADTSAEPLERAEALRVKILQWAQKARRVEAELVSWVIEATHRDIGAGD